MVFYGHTNIPPLLKSLCIYGLPTCTLGLYTIFMRYISPQFLQILQKLSYIPTSDMLVLYNIFAMAVEFDSSCNRHFLLVVNVLCIRFRVAQTSATRPYWSYGCEQDANIVSYSFKPFKLSLIIESSISKLNTVSNKPKGSRNEEK